MTIKERDEDDRVFLAKMENLADTIFADEAVRNCNKTSGNGEEATREPDLNSAARKPMQ